MSVQTITRSPANNNNTGELHYSDQFLQRLETDVECEKKKSKKQVMLFQFFKNIELEPC